MYIKRFFIVAGLLPALALGQQPRELMLPSMAGYLKKDIVVKPSTEPTPNSYDLALLANKKLIAAKTKYVFERTKTKVLNSTLSYGSDLIAKYMPFSSVTPVKTVFDLTVDEWISSKEDQDHQQFQDVIEKTFSAYTNAYLVHKPDATAADLSQHFSVFVKSDLIDAENYPLIGRKLDAFVLDYITANEKRFNELKNAVKSGMADGKKELSADNKLARIKVELKSEIQRSVTALERKQWEKLIDYQKSFEILQHNILGNYKAVYKDVDNMKGEIAENKKKIAKNTRAISLLTKKVESIQNDVALLNENNKALKIKTDETRRLVNENTYKTNVIADVLYNNVDVKGKLQLLRSGTVKVPNQKMEEQRLARISMIDDAERYFAIAGQSVELAQNLGLDEKDAKNMSTIIKGLGATAMLAKAYFTGDPLAGLEGINMGFAMFKSAKPDPLSGAMMQQFAKMNAKLDSIDTKIDSLSSKLSKMMNVQIAMHEENMAELARIQELEITINKKIDYQMRLFAASDITGVTNEMLNRFKNRADSCKTLECLGKEGLDAKFKILTAIYNATADSVIKNKPFLLYVAARGGADVQFGSFASQLEIIRLNRAGHINMLLSSLLLLPVNCGAANDIYNELRNKPERTPISEEEVADLLQPKEITRLSDILLLMEPFMYYGDPSKGFKTFSFADLSKRVSIADKNYSSRSRFKNLLFFCNVAIVQQNILNGGPNLQLFSHFLTESMPLDGETKKDVISCLTEKDNYYFQSNLATYILHNAIGENKIVFDLFKEIYAAEGTLDPNDERLGRLNGFLHIVNGAVSLNGNKKLALRITIPGNGDAELPIQLPQTIKENAMIYPPDVYDLYNTRVKLSNKLIEYDFIESIKSEKALSNLLYSNIFSDHKIKNN